MTTDFHAQHHSLPSLVRERPEPTVTLNSHDARERGIRDGDRVIVRTARGEIVLCALVTDGIVRGAVEANMGGGCHQAPEAWREGNVNELTDLARYDPISGFPVYKALLCDVARAENDGGRVAIGTGEVDSVAGAAPPPEAPRIYLDHNATTPLDPAVHQAMAAYLTSSPGNPSSIYREGETRRSPSSPPGGAAACSTAPPGGSPHRLLHRGEQHGDQGPLCRPGWDKKEITSPTEHSAVIEPAGG